MALGGLKINREDLDDVLVWKWSGRHDYDPEALETAREALRELLADVPIAKPVLLDLSRMRFSYTDGLADALFFGVRLKQSGYSVAVLLSPANDRMIGATRALKFAEAIPVFKDRDAALALLRSAGDPL